jgi:hypothetical protein
MLFSPYEFGKGYQASNMSIRQVCNNGQHLPVRIGGKILSHVKQFPKAAIKNLLEGAKTNWREYQETSEIMASTEVTPQEGLIALLAQFANIQSNKVLAQTLLAQLQAGTVTPKAAEELIWDKLTMSDESKIVQTCYEMFRNGTAIGGNKLSAHNTAWGLLQTVTEYYNHHSVSKDVNTQANSLWTGQKQSMCQSFLESISGFAHAKNALTAGSSVAQAVRAW